MIYFLELTPEARPDQDGFILHMAAPPMCHRKKNYQFFPVFPNFGYMKNETILPDWCDKLKWTSHLTPKWRQIREKETSQRRCKFMIGRLVISSSSIFPHYALKQNCNDHTHFYVLALKCAAYILCYMNPVNTDKTFLCFQHHSYILKSWYYPVHLPSC